MFPRPPWPAKLSKFFWKPLVYGNIPEIFYGMLEPSSPSNPDIWSKELKQEKVVGPREYSYFVINTAVGVGGKGKNDIKRVHIRFRLIPMDKTKTIPEVVSIYPHSTSQLAGQRKVSERTEKQVGMRGRVGAKQEMGIANAEATADGAFVHDKKDETDLTLPYYVVVANASGTGNRAMWEFYQEEKGMAAIGQFDLKIFFRIPNKDISQWPANGVHRNLYCIDWNVEINRKRLVDHTIDFEGNWNMKVNGRHLMDRCGNISYEEKISRYRKYQKLKYRELWNLSLPDLPPKKMDKYKKKIYGMMIEEEPKAERHKMLRPLYLVNNPVSNRQDQSPFPVLYYSIYPDYLIFCFV